MSIFNMLHEGSQGSGRDNFKGTVSARQFLGLEDGRSYSNSSIFLAYCLSLRESEIKDLELIVKCMKERLRINRYSLEKLDKAGRPYYFLHFTKAFADVTGKLILESGMRELLNDYIDGKAVVAFTLTELVESAKEQ